MQDLVLRAFSASRNWKPLIEDTERVLIGGPRLRAGLGRGMAGARAFKNLVFDIGGVLLTWSTADVSPLDPNTFGKILRSDLVHAYERGQISRDQFCNMVGDRFGVPAKDMKLVIERTAKSLRLIPEMVALVQDVKRGDPDLRLCCMSNISREEWQYLLQRYPDCWSSFEHIFPSWEAGLRKPQVEFFEHVIEEAKIAPEDTIFIDDTAANVEVAQELGFECVLHQNAEDTVRRLASLLPNIEACKREARPVSLRGSLD